MSRCVISHLLTAGTSAAVTCLARPFPSKVSRHSLEPGTLPFRHRSLSIICILLSCIVSQCVLSAPLRRLSPLWRGNYQCPSLSGFFSMRCLSAPHMCQPAAMLCLRQSSTRFSRAEARALQACLVFFITLGALCEVCAWMADRCAGVRVQS